MTSVTKKDRPPLRENELTPEYVAVLQKLTGRQKLQTLDMLYQGARQLKASGLRRLHPDWSEQQVEQEVRRLFRICGSS